MTRGRSKPYKRVHRRATGEKTVKKGKVVRAQQAKTLEQIVKEHGVEVETKS